MERLRAGWEDNRRELVVVCYGLKPQGLAVDPRVFRTAAGL